LEYKSILLIHTGAKEYDINSKYEKQ
jgi:hypothetical protein